MSDSQVNLPPLAAPPAAAAEATSTEGTAGESLPSQAMQAEDEARGFQPPSNTTLPSVKEERESQTARTLSLTLVWVLVGIFVIHYGLTAFLEIKYPQAVTSLEHIFNTAFPVFSGLVGTAVGFYLKERRG
jgi:hypothetical protein